jgi:subtilase family serine protease
MVIVLAAAALAVNLPPASGSGAAVHSCLANLTCYTPTQFRVAYGIQPLFNRGIDGRGETVVLLEQEVTAQTSSGTITNIHHDLTRFDSVFGLPAAPLQIVNTLAHSPSPSLADVEEVEDTEIVHAVAPDADIREILVSDADLSGTAATVKYGMAALRLGETEGAVISVSSSKSESCFTPSEISEQNEALESARARHVTVVISSGDFGVIGEPCPSATGNWDPATAVNLLASDPLALAVGGTSLRASHSTGVYGGESVWNTPPRPPAVPESQASGGGFSKVFRRPTYQNGVPGIGAFRGVPDVAGDANGVTGMALAATDGAQHYIIVAASGTSAAAPFWAGVIALADQYAGRHLGFVNPALYEIGRSPQYHQAFHNVTTGTNTVIFPDRTYKGYQAGAGWNPVTGWGSPDAKVLVPLLARYDKP